MTAAPGWLAWIEGAQLASTFAMTGVIWLVQVVQYPGFSRDSACDFRSFHAHHCRSIGFVVGPLMSVELLTSLVLAVSASPAWFWWSMLAALVTIWLSTGFVQGPLHSRLAREGPRPELLELLIRWNWLRTLLWTARSAGLVWFYARGWALS